jgi:hypothetical protein
MMSTYRPGWCAPALAALMATTAVTCSRGPTEEEKRRRGEALVANVSSTIAAAQALSFTAEEISERMGRDGKTQVQRLTREVKLRRPDRLWLKTSGERSVKASTKASS